MARALLVCGALAAVVAGLASRQPHQWPFPPAPNDPHFVWDEEAEVTIQIYAKHYRTIEDHYNTEQHRDNEMCTEKYRDDILQALPSNRYWLLKGLTSTVLGRWYSSGGDSYPGEQTILKRGLTREGERGTVVHEGIHAGGEWNEAIDTAAPTRRL